MSNNTKILDRLSAAARELQEASDALVQASLRRREADSAETAAMNRCNEAQKAFDAVTAELRKAAPLSTDWRARQPGLPA